MKQTEKLWKQIQLILADEINQAHKDNQPSSRLTSAWNRISELLK